MIENIDGQVVTLDSPLKHQHLGSEETYGVHNMPFRAEVGLLTRNIIVRGDDSSE